ncbi:DUF6612 family protein [Leucobacter chromiireducens]|uniref:DUF6612 family protein n=1 Tax=Leucobacter chromiireducens TaxID=283877 RepID=UPI000F638872|nr:DUF6612 family protein [Leucobacter chromiireducens]
MKLSRKTSLTASLILAGGLALSGCSSADAPAQGGSTSAEQGGSTQAPAASGPLTQDNFIERIAAAQLAAGTMHLTMDMGDSVDGNFEADQQLSKDPAQAKMRMTMSTAGVESELVLVDGKLYMNMGELSQNKFIDMSADDASAGDIEAMIAQVNPETQLAAFREALTDFTAEPDATEIDGVKTTHLTLTLDTEKMFAASVPEGTDIDALVAQLGDSVVYEMYVGSDDLPRRIVMPNVAGLGTATQEFTRWGEPVAIEAPAADEIIDPATLQG